MATKVRLRKKAETAHRCVGKLTEGVRAPSSIIHKEKAMAIEDIMKAVEKKYGKGVIKTSVARNKAQKMERVSTGIFSLDVDLGGGIPRGRAIEIFGNESTGKTYLVQRAVGVVSRLPKNNKTYWADQEACWEDAWAERNGVKTENVYVAHSDTAEECLDLFEMAALDDECDYIVLDSIPALITKEARSGSMDENQMADKARLLSKHASKMWAAQNEYMKSGEVGPTLLYINQLRDKVGIVWGSKETTPGGKAKNFLFSIRIRLSSEREEEKGEEDNTVQEVLWQTTKYHILKNKTFTPGRRGEFTFCVSDNVPGWKRGDVNNYAGLLRVGLYAGVIERGNKGWYTVGSGKGKKSLQGDAKAYEFLAEQKYRQPVVKAIKEKLGPLIHPQWLEW